MAVYIEERDGRIRGRITGCSKQQAATNSRQTVAASIRRHPEYDNEAFIPATQI
jgi:hypothetical protein